MGGDYYLYFVYILLALAVADLVVGVSNDAVNFLNSAVGSKVAPRHIIMIVASLGILLGATFSSGMMEVARSGIFNPALFSFAEVMVIFLAVMFTDIILLDLFNTFGMPTSTTVSIVFELLGAALAVAVFRIFQNDIGFDQISTYINSSGTLTIISGIFLSVSIAFTFGVVVQWVSRLLFSFQYERRMKWVGGIWAGLAVSAISYYLLFKGIKGASFVSPEFIQWVSDHTLTLFLASFAIWSVVMQLLISVFRVDVLRPVVLFGTFSLAMAFAGNDLVNFIGVPLAGLDAFRDWQHSAELPGAYMMDRLNEPVRSNTWFLLVAGLVMVLTLWLSKKARTVTETEVNLGRQDDGHERFASNWLARHIVWHTRKIATGVSRVLPAVWLEKSEIAFKNKPVVVSGNGQKPPAFDLVRASVNLTVASALIASATAMKLPLSTTYVTFMVAMGTSLADRAWGRGSAVFRVAGVLNVIGGWFLTAIVAFTAGGLFALLLRVSGAWGVVLLCITAVLLFSRTILMHRRMEKQKTDRAAFEMQEDALYIHHIMDETTAFISQLLPRVAKVYQHAVDGLSAEDRRTLSVARRDLKELERQNQEVRSRLYRYIKRFRDDSAEASRLYLLVYDLEQDLIQSVRLIAEESEAYVANSLPPLSPEQLELLREPVLDLQAYFEFVARMIREQDFSHAGEVQRWKKRLFTQLESSLQTQVEGVRNNHYSMRNSTLLFTLGLETKDLISATARFVKLFHRMQKVAEQSGGARVASV
mgnify:CR=1 FL=1